MYIWLLNFYTNHYIANFNYFELVTIEKLKLTWQYTQVSFSCATYIVKSKTKAIIKDPGVQRRCHKMSTCISFTFFDEAIKPPISLIVLKNMFLDIYCKKSMSTCFIGKKLWNLKCRGKKHKSIALMYKTLPRRRIGYKLWSLTPNSLVGYTVNYQSIFMIDSFHLPWHLEINLVLSFIYWKGYISNLSGCM